jgi:hypothetical protein
VAERHVFFSEVGVFRVERSGFRLGEAVKRCSVFEQGDVLRWSASGFALWRRDGQTEVVKDAPDNVWIENAAMT